MKILSIVALGLMALVLPAQQGQEASAAERPVPESRDWEHKGIFGTFDRHQLQRGYQVYREVCAGCHSMDYVYFRNLRDIGYSDEQVAAFAEEAVVQAGPDEFGEMYERPGRPSDPLPSPFPNEAAARAANNNAYPPDLSVITLARPHGIDYMYALLTGYKDDAPDGMDLPVGMYYNTAFGGPIAMVPPLSEGIVEYADGTEATVNQMAEDVSVFLAWAGQPEMEERKQMGIKVILFLLLLTAVLYALKRKIWSRVH